MPEGPINIGKVFGIPEGEVCSRVEAPRGENFHYNVSSGPKPYRYRVRPPTYANFLAIPEILRGYQISDAAPIVASIDPCFCCTDRVAVIDADSGARRSESMKVLAYGHR
jgi:Ni,Fe-hydrogenase III large subunit